MYKPKLKIKWTNEINELRRSSTPSKQSKWTVVARLLYLALT